MNSCSFKSVINKMCLQIIYIFIMYKEFLAYLLNMYLEDLFDITMKPDSTQPNSHNLNHLTVSK